MDKQLIEEMKRSAKLRFKMAKDAGSQDDYLTLSAIQAYAALCQAEAMHEMTQQGQQVDADWAAMVGNRTDQSIVDALGE